MSSTLLRKSALVLIVFSLSAVIVMGNKFPQGAATETGKLLQVKGRVSVNGTAAISGTIAPGE